MWVLVCRRARPLSSGLLQGLLGAKSTSSTGNVTAALLHPRMGTHGPHTHSCPAATVTLMFAGVLGRESKHHSVSDSLLPLCMPLLLSHCGNNISQSGFLLKDIFCVSPGLFFFHRTSPCLSLCLPTSLPAYMNATCSGTFVGATNFCWCTATSQNPLCAERRLNQSVSSTLRRSSLFSFLFDWHVILKRCLRHLGTLDWTRLLDPSPGWVWRQSGSSVLAYL